MYRGDDRFKVRNLILPIVLGQGFGTRNSPGNREECRIRYNRCVTVSVGPGCGRAFLIFHAGRGSET